MRFAEGSRGSAEVLAESLKIPARSLNIRETLKFGLKSLNIIRTSLKVDAETLKIGRDSLKHLPALKFWQDR